MNLSLEFSSEKDLRYIYIHNSTQLLISSTMPVFAVQTN